MKFLLGVLATIFALIWMVFRDDWNKNYEEKRYYSRKYRSAQPGTDWSFVVGLITCILFALWFMSGR